jgi:hypothetical protein
MLFWWDAVGDFVRNNFFSIVDLEVILNLIVSPHSKAPIEFFLAFCKFLSPVDSS